MSIGRLEAVFEKPKNLLHPALGKIVMRPDGPEVQSPHFGGLGGHGTGYDFTEFFQQIHRIPLGGQSLADFG